MYIIQYNNLNNQIKPLRGLIIFKKTYRELSEEGLTSLAENGLNVEFLLYGILYNKNFLLIAIEIE